MCRGLENLLGREIGRGRYLVDITQDDVLDSVVLEDFTHDATVTTSNDQYPLRVWMARQWEMGDHLLVPACILIDHAVNKEKEKRENSRKLIALSALDDAIQNKHVPKSLRLEDEDVLV